MKYACFGCRTSTITHNNELPFATLSTYPCEQLQKRCDHFISSETVRITRRERFFCRQQYPVYSARLFLELLLLAFRRPVFYDLRQPRVRALQAPGKQNFWISFVQSQGLDLPQVIDVTETTSERLIPCFRR